MLRFSFAAVAVVCFFTVEASAVAPLTAAADALDALSCSRADVTARLDLPGSQEPVEYAISFITEKTAGDSLLGYNYLIDWTLHRAQGDSQGFSAYYDGTHLRFRDTRLQEYHAADNVRPLTGPNAVQRQVQFADLLPGAVAATLRDIAADSTWSYRISERPGTVRIDATQRVAGYDALELEITFDAKNHLPTSITKVYNPASISEQEVTYSYTWLKEACTHIDEEVVSARYPEVFAKFRADNFKAMSLQGHPLPGYALNDRDGVRHTHRRGQPLERPTIYAFVNPEIVTMPQTVADIREALASLPTDVAVVWITPGTVSDEELSAADGELVLPAGSGMIIDCGISGYPTLLFVGTDGKVANTLIGQNNNMVEVVTQQTMSMN